MEVKIHVLGENEETRRKYFFSMIRAVSLQYLLINLRCMWDFVCMNIFQNEAADLKEHKYANRNSFDHSIYNDKAILMNRKGSLRLMKDDHLKILQIVT